MPRNDKITRVIGSGSRWKLTNIEKFISEADGEMVKAKKDLEDAEN